MRTETPNGKFCNFREEKTADGAKGKVSEVSVQLHRDPRRSAPRNRFISTKYKYVAVCRTYKEANGHAGQGWKKPGFSEKKTQPTWVFWVLYGFSRVFWGLNFFLPLFYQYEQG